MTDPVDLEAFDPEMRARKRAAAEAVDDMLRRTGYSHAWRLISGALQTRHHGVEERLIRG